uniref:Uncharacterized protein n=1 Tax=Glossina palpalis gambiensis TaxID=67801 RepID=A0A1B0BN70_9MUSC
MKTWYQETELRKEKKANDNFIISNSLFHPFLKNVAFVLVFEHFHPFLKNVAFVLVFEHGFLSGNLTVLY